MILKIVVLRYNNTVNTLKHLYVNDLVDEVGSVFATLHLGP